MDIEKFLNEVYALNKSNSSIVTKEFIINKAGSLFFSGIWGQDYVGDRIIEDKERIVFGLKSGIIFLKNDKYDYADCLYIAVLIPPRGIDGSYFYRKCGIGNSYFKLNSEESYIRNTILFQTKNKSETLEITNDAIIFYNALEKEINYYTKIQIDESLLLRYIIEKWFIELKIIEEKKKELEIRNENEKIKNENERVQRLNILKSNAYSDLDKDDNGEIDLVNGDTFNKLIIKNQKNIIDIDKNYIQKFVKISLYLKTKKNNIQKIFESIKDTKNENQLNELVSLLKNQIHTYELLVFHSISMVTSLVESDLINFYEIYECFDQLGVFNSNWENEVSNKLINIGDGIINLMHSIYELENKIVSSIDNLTYVTQDSFKEFNTSVNKQLSSIESSLDFNNLLTGIQTYQMYKINKNTLKIN